MTSTPFVMRLKLAPCTFSDAHQTMSCCVCPFSLMDWTVLLWYELGMDSYLDQTCFI